VYDHVGTLIHHLSRRVKLLTNVVSRVLSLTEAMICNLQLPVLFGRGNCTTIENVILALQLCKLTCGRNVVLLISNHVETLLKNNGCRVVLQVERVLHIFSQCNLACMVVRTLRVRYGLKALLPNKLSPEAEWKECDRCRGGVNKAAPTQ
jgi:hypothetical protein